VSKASEDSEASKFDGVKEFLDKHLENRRQALNNQEVSRWSSSDCESYAELMKIFGRAEVNEKVSELYALEKTGATGADLAAQQGYRMMVHFMASLERCARIQNMSGNSHRQRSASDHARAIFTDKRIAQATLERLHDYINKKAGV